MAISCKETGSSLTKSWLCHLNKTGIRLIPLCKLAGVLISLGNEDYVYQGNSRW